MTLVLEEKENHDQAVKRFYSLCDMHRIACAQAGSLRQLVTALKENRHFAMDFWAMVGDLSARERGTLSDDEMLATIVEGSSGKTISELSLNEKVMTAGLKNMLAGVDVDAESMEEEASASESEPPIASPRVELSAEHLPLEEETRRVEAAFSAEPARAAAVVETKHSVEEALRRLEETSRELRDQLAALAAMDQLRRETASREQAALAEKVSEPSPAAGIPALPMPAQQNLPPEPKAAIIEAPAAAAATQEFAPAPAPVEEPVLAPRIAPRMMEEREVFASPQFSTLSHRGYTPQDADDDPSIHVPLAEYAEANPRRIGVGTILLIVLVAALIAGGFALHKGYGRDQVARAKAAMLNKIGLFGEELHDVASPSSQSGSQNANNPQQPTAAPNEQAATSQNAASQASPAGDRPQLIPPAQQQAQGTPQESSGHSRSGVDGSYRAARPEAMPIEPGAVRVPSSVMNANLLSSRVAVYPEDAKAMGIEGAVEVEAVISTTGAVQYAHAISGDAHLRAAAEEAVMKWRYKPYAINGTPVQAVTQVRINFRLR
jgi:TonB family protein